MPIEKAYTDAILGTFRNMLQELKDKNSSGESFDKMVAVMDKMDQLALEMDDVGAFSTKLAVDGLYNEFSTAYGEVLVQESRNNKSPGKAYDDAALLQQTLTAYENSLVPLESHPDKEKLQVPIKEVIALGKSGVNYPTFLRLLIEKGLAEAMESTVLSRETLLKDVQWAEQLMLPVYIERNKAILEKYDAMAAVAAFNVPDSLQFSMERFRIERQFQPTINKEQAIIDRWMKLLQLLHDWIDAYTSFAPYDERYASAEGMQTTLRNIKFYKDCNPGFFKARLSIFNRYFLLRWDDIFTHPSFENERKAKRCLYTDVYVEFLKNVYLQCKPFSQPSAELIKRAEELHKKKEVFV